MADDDGFYDSANLRASFDGDYVNFTWKRTEGSKHYIFMLRHVHNKEHFIIRTNLTQNSYRYKTDDDVRYGQRYEMRIQFVWSDEATSNTKWQEFVLGGPPVPIFPNVRLNQENPQRSVVIEWEKPKLDPIGYRITSIPLYGRRKIYTCCECTITIFKLKSNTVYNFELQAQFDESTGTKESPRCKTSSIKTRPKPGATLATQTYDNIQGSTFHIKNPTSVHNSQVMKFNPSNFGKVENVEMITRSDDELEMAYIQWEDPYFLGERDDYEIKQYEVRIKQGSITMIQWAIQNKLRTEEFMINRGECYEIYIGTRYEEIDTEKPNYVALKEYFYSRPATPKVAIIEELDLVKVKWSGAKGAVEYRLEIFDANSTTPIVTEEKGKSFTNHTISKEEFYLGRYYNFVVTAYGKEKGKSHVKKEILLGGELVPRNARAVVNPHHPSNSIDIEWESPDKRPVSYEVKEVGCPHNVIETKETRCTMKGLRTGITYKFEVLAKHDEETISCASVTNDVKTDPRPGRIVEAMCGLCDHRPDKSIKLEWKPCFGATIYRIRASCEDTVREHYVRENKFHLDDLSPNTSYDINLSAGNDNGFGEENKIIICTEMEVPTRVILSYDAANGVLVGECGGRSHEMSSLWNLYKSHEDILIESKSSNGSTCQFDAFEGNAKYYATVQFVCEEMKSLKVSSNTLLSVPSQVTITKVTVSEDEPSTDFYINWEKQEGLIYQIKIDTDYKTERIVQSTNVGECHYRCLCEGNEYLVEIRAANDTGFGKWSGKEYIQLGCPKVRGLTAMNVDNSVFIKWEQPRSRLFSSLTSFYQVKIFENGHAVANEKVKETSFLFKNVKTTKKYDFSVVAIYDNDVCSQCESGFIAVEMGAPVNVTLRYDAEKDSLIAACGGRRSETSSTAWNLYKRHGDILVDSKTSYYLSCQFDSYENDTEYFVTVQFLCEKIKSVCVPSNTLLTVPSQVSISSVHVSEVEPTTDIHITWEPKEELTYEIQIITDHKTERIIRSENVGECFYKCLYEGNEYYVAMRASNSTGFGKWSKKYSVLLEPPKVRELTAVKVRDGISIRWKEPKNNHLSRAILFYLVEIRQSELLNEPLVQTKVKHAFFTFENVAPMKKYDFSVSAVYDNNIQSKFESGSITIEGLLPPKSARAVLDRYNPVCVHLCWFNGDAVAPGSRYLIIFNDKIVRSTHTDCTLSDLKPDTEYLVEIYSINEGITSESPAVVKFKTGKLAPVEFGAHEFDLEQPWRFVTLTWHRPPGSDKSLIRTNERDTDITTKKEFIKLEKTTRYRKLNVKITPIASGVSGKLDTTVHITMPEIPIAVSEYLKVKLCKECPWQYADIEWIMPHMITWSKVAVSPLSPTGNVIGLYTFERTFRGSFLRFERNCKESSYGLKIWTGYNSQAFGENYLEMKFMMGPDMPEVEETRWEGAKFFIVFEEADLAIDKLILTVCEDSQVVITQEVDWPVPRSTVEITGLPERNFDFYMETVWRSYRRPKKIIEPHSRWK